MSLRRYDCRCRYEYDDGYDVLSQTEDAGLRGLSRFCSLALDNAFVLTLHLCGGAERVRLQPGERLGSTITSHPHPTRPKSRLGRHTLARTGAFPSPTQAQEPHRNILRVHVYHNAFAPSDLAITEYEYAVRSTSTQYAVRSTVSSRPRYTELSTADGTPTLNRMLRNGERLSRKSVARPRSIDPVTSPWPQLRRRIHDRAACSPSTPWCSPLAVA